MLNVNIRNYFLQELSKITYGSIKIFTPEGELITYISKGADKNSSTELTELVLYNWSVIKNLFFKGINAIIQDYSIGKFKTNNLYNLLGFLLLNKFIKYS